AGVQGSVRLSGWPNLTGGNDCAGSNAHSQLRQATNHVVSPPSRLPACHGAIDSDALATQNELGDKIRIAKSEIRNNKANSKIGNAQKGALGVLGTSSFLPSDLFRISRFVFRIYQGERPWGLLF